MVLPMYHELRKGVAWNLYRW